MRYFMLTLLLGASVITSARDLFVVLYTSDAEVVDMYCESAEMNLISGPVAYRSVVLTRGTVSWHAVGGVPPYTDLRAERGAGGTISITVMDAACNTYTARGIIGVRRISKMVDCSSEERVSLMPTVSQKLPTTHPKVADGEGRSNASGARRVSYPTSSRPVPAGNPRPRAVRIEGTKRPAPRPTAPTPRTASRYTSRSR